MRPGDQAWSFKPIATELADGDVFSELRVGDFMPVAGEVLSKRDITDAEIDTRLYSQMLSNDFLRGGIFGQVEVAAVAADESLGSILERSRMHPGPFDFSLLCKSEYSVHARVPRRQFEVVQLRMNE